MKHILTLASLAFATACFGQEACPAPIDVNSNGAVDIEDFLNVLGLFGDTDYDADGIWDSVDDCVGAYDVCGVCNGPGFPEGYCSCTETVDALGNCGGDCEFDTDGDGVCDQYYGSCTADFVVYQGHQYATVEIDNQCWFAENLRSIKYSNGDSIALNVSASDWAILDSGATAIYGEGEIPCDHGWCEAGPNYCDSEYSYSLFGRLYNWYAVHDERGLCPSGWHVPSKEEFESLIELFGGYDVAGDALKAESELWACGSYSDMSNNASGFSALLGGHRDTYPEFWDAGVEGFWWTSSSWDLFALGAGVSTAQIFGETPQQGYSVRCIKDSE